jgi:hypothetical protein
MSKDEEKSDSEGLTIENSPDTFMLKGRIPITKTQILYILLGIAMLAGVSHEQILQIVATAGGL